MTARLSWRFQGNGLDLQAQVKFEERRGFASMEWNLNAAEVRVLGSLIEKAISTPDYYPLSLNGLVNACNQKSNREPFLTLDEDAVLQAVHTLGDKGLASGARSSGRVAKYEHRTQEVFNFGRGEEAVVCVLMLRGPQTAGELRARTDRLFLFGDRGDVESTLERLMQREPPIVKVLPRSTGEKEVRYIHLLSPIKSPGTADSGPPREDGSSPAAEPERRDELASLRQDLDQLQDQVDKLAAQVALVLEGRQV